MLQRSCLFLPPQNLPLSEVSGANTEDGDGGEDEGGGNEDDGGYVSKVRSLFPSLKVRDGKRILMKKSHVYYQNRAANDDDNSNGNSTPKPDKDRKRDGSGRNLKHPATVGKAEQDEDERMKGNERGHKDTKVSSKKEEGASEKHTEKRQGLKKSDPADAEEELRGKKERKLKKRAARAAKATKGGEGVVEEIVGNLSEIEASVNVDVKHRRHPKEEASVALKPKKKKRRREEEELSKHTPSVVPDEQHHQQQQQLPLKTAATETTNQNSKKHDKKLKKTKQVKQKSSEVAKVKSSRQPSNPNGTDGGGLGAEQDPYSSSEDLPIPGIGRKTIKNGVADEGAVKKRATPLGGDAESGVVSIVLNKKRKGATKGSRGKAWQGGVGLESDGVEQGGGAERGFSVGAMLEARAQRETVGLVSGVSAWD